MSLAQTYCYMRILLDVETATEALMANGSPCDSVIYFHLAMLCVIAKADIGQPGVVFLADLVIAYRALWLACAKRTEYQCFQNLRSSSCISETFTATKAFCM